MLWSYGSIDEAAGSDYGELYCRKCKLEKGIGHAWAIGEVPASELKRTRGRKIITGSTSATRWRMSRSNKLGSERESGRASKQTSAADQRTGK